jgi:hypothetical protein
LGEANKPKLTKFLKKVINVPLPLQGDWGLEEKIEHFKVNEDHIECSNFSTRSNQVANHCIFDRHWMAIDMLGHCHVAISRYVVRSIERPSISESKHCNYKLDVYTPAQEFAKKKQEPVFQNSISRFLLINKMSFAYWRQ